MGNFASQLKLDFTLSPHISRIFFFFPRKLGFAEIIKRREERTAMINVSFTFQECRQSSPQPDEIDLIRAAAKYIDGNMLLF